MKAVTSFNGWVISKMVAYLTGKEGFSMETFNYTWAGAQVVVKDAFGFRYEINIKTLSRVNNAPNDTELMETINNREAV